MLRRLTGWLPANRSFDLSLEDPTLGRVDSEIPTVDEVRAALMAAFRVSEDQLRLSADV
jgi:hypothetical protein